MKNVITHKHIEAIFDNTITIIFTISGNFQAHFLGKIIGRIRNRFKQYVFIPDTPFTSFFFSLDDIEKIETLNSSFLITMKKNVVSKPKKKKYKKKEAPVIAENSPINLNEKVSEIDSEEIISMSA